MSDTMSLCTHRPWRRWAITHRAAGVLFRLRILSGIGHREGGGCTMCLDFVRIGPWTVIDDD